MGMNDEKIMGYNPVQYKRMTILFVILSLLNIFTVTVAFMRSGYGLYHAEDALSHVAKITQCVQSVNENSLNIVMHADDSKLVESEKTYIDSMFDTMDEESEKYLEINLDSIDKKLRGNFDTAKEKVNRYHEALNAFNDDILKNAENNSADGNTVNKVMAAYTINIEPLKTDAEVSMNDLFDLQNKTTYDFFVRCAQQFLFVLLFLAVTMTVGIIGIKKMRKNAKISAETAVEEHNKAVSSQNKAIDIAYTNILTGLKNRYSLEEDFTDNLSSKIFTSALFGFSDFDKLNGKYGRSTADEFLSNVSQILVREFGKSADIYSTESNEFCFVFKDRMVSTIQTEKIINNIMDVLSAPMEIGEITVQLTASCSYCEYKPNSHMSFDKLLILMDRAMSAAKQNSSLTNSNCLISAN